VWPKNIGIIVYDFGDQAIEFGGFKLIELVIS
jgi:hypothetical protein